MKLLSKITILALAISFASFFVIPIVSAQTALDDIKARLEEEGITVVDYSSPEGQWGSLTTEWIKQLKAQGFTSLSNLADSLQTNFVGNEESLTALRRKLAIAISDKSQKTIKEDIDAADAEIFKLQGDAQTPGLIQLKELEIKNAISNAIGSPQGLNKDVGINLIFKEVDFYFNYSKWGRLPQRIIGVLEREKYTSLQQLAEVAKGAENIATTLTGVKDLSSDDIRTISDSVAILSASGERQINELALGVVNTIKNIVAGLAVIWIVYAGARMIFAQGDENVISEQKRAIFYGILGLVAILLVGRGVDFLYGPAGVVRTELTHDQGFSNEVYGMATFLKAIVGIIAILFIIISGIRMMFAAGDESEITKQRTSLLWVGVGLILIAVDQVIVKNLFVIPVANSDQIKTSNVTALINTLGTVLQFVLGFVGLIAFAILIYGAATMIANYGDEQMVEKSKKIIKNAIIGILVILSAYTIVATLVIFR
jgi:hypothetical protein